MFKAESFFLKPYFLLLGAVVLGCSPTREGLNASGTGETAARVQGTDSESKAVQMVAIDFDARTATTYSGLTAADLPQSAAAESPDSAALEAELEKLVAAWQKDGSPAYRRVAGTIDERTKILASIGLPSQRDGTLALAGGNRSCIANTGRALVGVGALIAGTSTLGSPEMWTACLIGGVGIFFVNVRR
jgi:hypothetical protein